MRLRAAGWTLMLAGALAAPAAGQETGSGLAPVRALGGIQLVGALPVGEFADYIDGGFGLGVNVAAPVQAGSWLSLRGDLGWVVYGSETMEVCFQSTGCRVTLDLTTTNNIFFLGFGPQLAPPDGAVRPYLNATGGLAYFATTSSVRGDNDSEAFASDTNYDDITLAWGAGAGLLIPLSRGNTPVLLDLGAQYHGNGSVEYLKKGDIIENPSGPPTLNVTRSEANFVSIRLGVTIGWRPGAR